MINVADALFIIFEFVYWYFTAIYVNRHIIMGNKKNTSTEIQSGYNDKKFNPFHGKE